MKNLEAGTSLPNGPTVDTDTDIDFGYPTLTDWLESLDESSIRDTTPFIPSEGAWEEKHAPFALDPFDAIALQKIGGLTLKAIAARGYFSVPNSTEGQQWMRAWDFTEAQVKLGKCIGVPIRNQWGELQRFHLLPMRPRQNRRGDENMTVMPHRYLEGRCLYGGLHEAHLLDVSPMSYLNLDNGAETIVYTASPLGADSVASRGMVGVALPTKATSALKFQRILYNEYKDVLNLKAGFEHVFVFDASTPKNGVSYMNFRRFMLELLVWGEKVKIVTLHASPLGDPGTLGSFFAQGSTMADLLELAKLIDCDF